MLARIGELRTDACVFQRRLEHLLAQASAVVFPILDFAALPEGDGVVLLAALAEFGAPNAADAGRDAVVDEALVIDHREIVALLDAEEIDRPLVNVLHFRGQRIGQVLLHDRTPQRRIDRGALLGAAYREFLFSRLDADRILMEPEHHVLRHVAFVDQVVQVGGIERILVDEDGVFMPGTDVAQRENLFRGFVEPVDRKGRNAVPVQDFPQRFAAAHLARFGAVVVGVDAVNDILRRGFFLFGRGLLRSSVARPCGYEQQGAYR